MCKRHRIHDFFPAVLPVVLIDVVVFAFLVTWVIGGIPCHGKLLLRHGADPRRAALLIALAGAFFVPSWRQSSLILSGVRSVWRKLLELRWRWLLLGLACLWAIGLGVAQGLAIRFPVFDVGIFHQILWGISNGHGFTSSVSGAGNFLVDHFSPSLALLAPSFWLTGASPLTLAIVHPLLIWGGVAAWIYLAERAPGTSAGGGSTLAAFVLLFALGFNSLWANLRWGFHENSIYFAAMSWALALLFTTRPGWKRTCSVIALFCVAALSKEILLLNVALAFALLALPGTGHRWRQLAWKPGLIICALAAVVLFVWFEKIPHPAAKNYFDRYYSYLGHGLTEMARNLLLSPWRVTETVGWREILRYAGNLFFPWLGIPLVALFSKGEYRYVAIFLLAITLPSIFSAGLSTFPPLRDPGFHYVLEIWPAFAVVTILFLARSYAEHPERFRKIGFAFVLLAWIALDQDPWGQMREYTRGAIHMTPVRQHLAEIPVQDSVSLDEMAGPWLSGRMQAYQWPVLSSRAGECPDWLVLNEAHAKPASREFKEMWSRCLSHGRELRAEWSVDGWTGYRIR